MMLRKAGLGWLHSLPVHRRPLIWGARPSSEREPLTLELQGGRTLAFRNSTEKAKGLAYRACHSHLGA